jgi:hypothetical protein
MLMDPIKHKPGMSPGSPHYRCPDNIRRVPILPPK